jgi:hypothetical protein
MADKWIKLESFSTKDLAERETKLLKKRFSKVKLVKEKYKMKWILYYVP